MARWRLQTAHYLYTDPPTEWEHRETSRETGRQTTVKYKVPRLLEPKDPGDHNYPDEIIVSDGKGNVQRKDIVFLGDPTPEMEPVDDEARVITEQFINSGKWRKPEEGMLHGEMLIRDFMEQIARVQATPVQVQPVSAASVSSDDFKKLQEQVQALMEQNAALQAQALERRRI